MALKWGIISVGKISQDFANAVQTLPTSDHKIAAVAAQNLEKARVFASDHNIPKAYGDYKEIAKDDEVDVVYIGNLPHQHFATVKLMLDHGKAVLSETPVSLTEKQTRELIEIARQKKLFLMEAIVSRSFPAYKQLKKIIESGDIGDVVFASAHFGFSALEYPRFKTKEFRSSAIMDLGVYILQFQQFVFGGIPSQKITVNGHFNKYGVDESAGVVITYPNGKMSVMSVSIRCDLPLEAIVIGTKGTIKIPNYWCPTQIITPEKIYDYELPKTETKFNYVHPSGLAYEAEEVRQCIKAGRIESACLTHDESIEIARLLEVLRKEVGVIFPEDLE